VTVLGYASEVGQSGKICRLGVGRARCVILEDTVRTRQPGVAVCDAAGVPASGRIVDELAPACSSRRCGVVRPVGSDLEVVVEYRSDPLDDPAGERVGWGLLGQRLGLCGIEARDHQERRAEHDEYHQQPDGHQQGRASASGLYGRSFHAFLIRRWGISPRTGCRGLPA